MPQECFGTPPPRIASILDVVASQSATLLERRAAGDELSQNEREYLKSAVELVNAVLFFATDIVDYFPRGSFRNSTMPWRMSVSWIRMRTIAQWAPALREIRDTLDRVIITGTSSQTEMTAAAAYLRSVSASTREQYGIG